MKFTWDKLLACQAAEGGCTPAESRRHVQTYGPHTVFAYAVARNWDGVMPMWRRNDAVKWLWLA